MYNTTEKALKNILLNKSSLTHRSIQFGFFEILGKAKLTESDRRLISFCLLPGVRGIDWGWVWENFSGWWKDSVSQKWWCSNRYMHLSELTEQCAKMSTFYQYVKDTSIKLMFLKNLILEVGFKHSIASQPYNSIASEWWNLLKNFLKREKNKCAKTLECIPSLIHILRGNLIRINLICNINGTYSISVQTKEGTVESNDFLRELHYLLRKGQTENEIVKILLQLYEGSSSQEFQCDSRFWNYVYFCFLWAVYQDFVFTRQVCT